MPTPRTTTERVIEAIAATWDTQTTWTVRQVADSLAAPEYPVRAAVGWLRRARRVIPDKQVKLKDRSGRPYFVQLYRIAERGSSINLKYWASSAWR